MAEESSPTTVLRTDGNLRVVFRLPEGLAVEVLDIFLRDGPEAFAKAGN